MPKGHKRIKGVPELHNEVKKRVNMSLTPTATEGLDALAQGKGISRSELVEQIGRGKLFLVDVEEEKTEIQELQQLKFHAVKLLPINQSFQLPPHGGVYLVINHLEQVISGYTDNLNYQFNKPEFSEKLKSLFFSSQSPDNNLYLFWIECLDLKLLPKLQKFIIEVFYKKMIENGLEAFLTNEFDQEKFFSQS